MKSSKTFFFILSFILNIFIGILDFYTNESISISFFYLIPISISSWFCGKNAGIIIALISSFTWLFIDIIISSASSSPLVPYWNGFMQMFFFLFNSFLLSKYKKLLEKEKLLAREDQITGILNRNAFNELARLEIERAKRYKYPMTLGFIDIDDFKKINDQFGHNKGDYILKNVAQNIQRNTRKSDIFARIGGDEFVLLLPNIDIHNSKIIFSKISNLISNSSDKVLDITASIGVVTFKNIPDTIEDLLSKADSSMYQIKHSLKNGINHDIY